MGRFMTHEPIAAGAFNRDYCSTTSVMASWQAELSNTLPILELLLQRLESDYLGLHPKMRKAYGLKEVEACQRNCAAFLATCAAFKSKYPEKFVAQEEPGLLKASLGWVPVNPP